MSANAAAPASAYVYSALTFLTIFSLITGTLLFIPTKVLEAISVNRLLFSAVGILSGLALGAIAGIQTWLRCIRAHTNRLEFETKRKQLLEDFGPAANRR